MGKQKQWLCALCVLMLLPLFLISVHADMGPKPSVNVTIEGLDGRECWGTLLSETSSTGPYSAYRSGAAHPEVEDEEYLAWLAFQTWSKSDPDGYYFLQFLGDASDGSFRWGYYPPQTFKIALWFPEEDVFVVSGIAERFAFDSYYTVQLDSNTVAQLEQGQSVTALPVKRSYPAAMELTTFLIRAALTFAVELLIALLFGLWRNGLWKVLLSVNLATQILLNLGLNLYLYFCGNFIIMLFLAYLLAELAVVLVELMAYKFLLAGETKTYRKKLVLYTWVANLASFAFGIFLSLHAPILF